MATESTVGGTEGRKQRERCTQRIYTLVKSDSFYQPKAKMHDTGVIQLQLSVHDSFSSRFLLTLVGEGIRQNVRNSY